MSKKLFSWLGLILISTLIISVFYMAWTPFPSASSMPVNSVSPQPYDGYTLFAPMQSNITYLINNSGEVVHTWEAARTPGGNPVRLLEDGSILHPELAPPGSYPFFATVGGGGATQSIQIIDWNGTVNWEFDYSLDYYQSHHGLEMLPNGNVLIVAWEYKTAGEAVDAGRNPELLVDGELYPDHVIEVQPTGPTTGSIVWEWHVWDHLIQDFNPSMENYGIVANHPELVDINYVSGRAKANWMHTNSVDYNEDFDQILLSVKGFNEIWIIDHSTTTEEAAGHFGGNSGKGGDLLYRWGNPQTYRAGNETDQKLFAQHDATWIASDCPGAGNILVFNNQNPSPDGRFSSVDEIIPPVDDNGTYFLNPESPYAPLNQTWVYTADNATSLYNQGQAGAQRLPNGNTLICHTNLGRFFEVTMEKETIWEYINPFPNQDANEVFQIRRYGHSYPGLRNLLVSDLAITTITAEKTMVMQGEEVAVHVTVENQGTYTETSNLTLYADTTRIGEAAVNNMEQGTNRTIDFSWNTTDFSGSYVIAAEIDVVENETDILDNILIDGSILVDGQAPEISHPFQAPPGVNPEPNQTVIVQEHQPVTVTVNATDLVSGVKNVFLRWMLENESVWHLGLMEAVSADTFEYTLPGYENGTSVLYQIVAYDNVGHASMSPATYELMYNIEFIVEFQSFLLLSLFSLVALLVVIVYRKKLPMT